MNLDLIKILGIFLVTLCCIVATYTDVKRQIIPNKLNISLFFIGILLVTFYFHKSGFFNYFYYISILLVYAFSYVLWYLGVWAGGDVKLLTAISTVFIPEFLDVIPKYTIFSIVLPYNLASFKIPTFLLIFNSVLAIIPMIIIIVFIKILKDKPHLIDEFKKTFDYKEGLLSLNSLMISYIIIQEINVYDVMLKIAFLLIFSYLLLKIMKNDIIFIIFSLALLIHQILSANMILYILEFMILLIMISVRNIFKTGIVKEALTSNVNKNDLKEGMILAYPLYYGDNGYYFRENNLLENLSGIFSDKYEKNLVCGVKASGLSSQDIFLIRKYLNQDFIKIKQGLSFAPFILVGLLITVLIGNTYELMILLMGGI